MMRMSLMARCWASARLLACTLALAWAATPAMSALPGTSVSWVEPLASARNDQSIELWLRLSVDPGAAQALVLDGSGGAFDLPQDLPGWASISHIDTQAWLACENTFMPGACNEPDSAYTFEYNGSGPDTFGTYVGGHTLPLNLTLAPGQSRDFLIGSFVPRLGQVPPGTYTLSNAGLQLYLSGTDIHGDAVYTTIGLGSGCNGGPGCTVFERNVTAVPEPAAALMLLAGVAVLAWRRRG